MTGAARPRAGTRPAGLSAYVAVTAAYRAFMLTDGALRMLVLLHFHGLGFSPLQLATLFLFYELAGIVTNLAAGCLAARFGLRATLYAGLAIQVAALAALSRPDPGWAMGASVVYVMAVPAALAAILLAVGAPAPGLSAALVAGLWLFGAGFAVKSALHSYLILAFTRADRVTMDVGFYYMSNASGRLLGTLLSGLSYQAGGLALTLAVAAAMLAVSALAAGRLAAPDPAGGQPGGQPGGQAETKGAGA